MSILLRHPPNINIVKNGLVLWLNGKDFRNSPPTNSWRDKSGKRNNATSSNFAYTPSSGSNNYAGVIFDGVDDYVVIPNNSIFQFGSGDFSLEIRFKRMDTYINQEVIISKKFGSGGGLEAFQLYLINNQLRLEIGSTTGSYYSISTNNIIIDNVHHHIIAMRKGNTMSIYY